MKKNCCTIGVNPGLPGNFDVLHVSFMLPSPQELLCHLYTVCSSILEDFPLLCTQAVKENRPNLY